MPGPVGASFGDGQEGQIGSVAVGAAAKIKGQCHTGGRGGQAGEDPGGFQSPVLPDASGVGPRHLGPVQHRPRLAGVVRRRRGYLSFGGNRDVGGVDCRARGINGGLSPRIGGAASQCNSGRDNE